MGNESLNQMKGKDRDSVIKALNFVINKKLNNKDVVFMCIGTDRSTGDCLGPLVGTYLKELGYDNVFGTIDEPVHAINLKETIEKIESHHPDALVIAIDACLGQFSSVGNINVALGPLKPGAGVKKNLPEVGDFHITGIVNIDGFMEYFVLQNTRLSVVMKMANEISSAIQSVFPLKQEEKRGTLCQLIQSYLLDA